MQAFKRQDVPDDRDPPGNSSAASNPPNSAPNDPKAPDHLLSLPPTTPKSLSRPKLARTRSKSNDVNITTTTTAEEKAQLLQTTISSPPRRQSFNAYTLKSFASLSPGTGSGTGTLSSSFPRMMTTMNMASRLAGPRVKDQTIHHSFSDRSSTHAKPAPAQDSKGSRSGGYSADGLKRISTGLRGEWSEGRVAPCVSSVEHPSLPSLPQRHLPSGPVPVLPLKNVRCNTPS
jgi:hypothetical protein